VPSFRKQCLGGFVGFQQVTEHSNSKIILAKFFSRRMGSTHRRARQSVWGQA